jgi:hypothetical protein
LLNIDESEVFHDNNWYDPVITKYGLKIKNKSIAYKKYVENYYIIRETLKQKLALYRNVFTHNPWGEYGNEEHVQIYRVVRQLQREMNFNLWFSNYSSNKSSTLMSTYLQSYNFNYVTFEPNERLRNDIKKIYQKNHCWTWYDDWQWPDTECFIEDKPFDLKTEIYGHIVPINLISVEFAPESGKKTSRKLYGLNTITSKLFGKK